MAGRNINLVPSTMENNLALKKRENRRITVYGRDQVQLKLVDCTLGRKRMVLYALGGPQVVPTTPCASEGIHSPRLMTTQMHIE